MTERRAHPFEIGGAGKGREPLTVCRMFLRSLGQTVKLVTLYRSNHPVPASSMQESLHLIHEIFTETGWSEAAFSLIEGSWLVNGEKLGEANAVSDVLSLVFRGHAIESATFLPAIRLHELASLCDLAATPAHHAYETDADAFLRQRGCHNIRVNVEEFARVRKAPGALPSVRNPIPHEEPGGTPRRASPGRPPGGGSGAGSGSGSGAGSGGGAGPGRGARSGSAGGGLGGGGGSGAGAGAGEDGSSQGFGSFIKNLVEQSVSSPVERAKVYAETVQMVKRALEGHVAEATRKLRAERNRAASERDRAESVVSAVAEGRFVVDKDGRVIMMDSAAEELAGKRLVEVAGKPLTDSVKTDSQMLSMAKDLTAKDADGTVSSEMHVVGEAEMIDAFRKSVAIVQDEEGRLVGTYSVLPYMSKFREALKLQEQFVASVTHELKTPLAAIGSALEILDGEAKKDLGPEMAKLLDVSRRNARVLQQMIGEILDFSRLQSGRMSVHPEACSPAAIVRESVEGLMPWAQGRAIRLSIENPERLSRLPLVAADQNRVVQVLNNLISNAIKATPERGSIWVTAQKGLKEHDGAVVFSVRDNGCGIAQADQKRIFEKFTQLHTQGVRREGVGLGLAIVHELVLLHKGGLWLESEEGRGATFFFSIPEAGASPR